jgi:hypothetical protein
MTPLAGLIMAVIAGWFVRGPRLAAAVVVVPFLAVAGAQTWRIAAGDGTSPPATVIGFPQAIGYWVVQAVFLALALGIAGELGFLRARRAVPRDAAGAGTRRAAIVAGILAVPTTVFVALYVAGSSPVRHHAASGSPPLQGFLGIVLCVVALATLSVPTVMARRSAARAERAGGEASVAATGRPL